MPVPTLKYPADNTAVALEGWDGLERRTASGRRIYTVKTLWQSVRQPRRMAGRRREDRLFPMLDRFDSGVVTLAITLVLLSIVDSMLTLTLIAGGGTEVNPIMNSLLSYSVWAFAGVKMLLTAIPAVVLVAVGNLKLFGRMRARSMLAALVGVYLGLIVYEIGLIGLL
ncbi:MAG: DUF5658 family protein [Granulosicoccus sp.]